MVGRDGASETSTPEHSVSLRSKLSGTVWIICDYPLIYAGLEAAFGEEMRVKQVENLEGVGDQEGEPSCVLVCAGQDDTPLELAELRRPAPGIPIVVVGLINDAALARSALQKGARGFVHVGMQPSQIRTAISMVRKGEMVVPREIITDLIRQEAPVDVFILTPRQREILQLVAEGLTNAQIARRLFLSEYTIKQHLRAAYKLLGVRNRTQAVRLYRSLEEK
jgi:DNA-binding NarL/FixJ family response regulator